jgi:hypothetical protein
MQYLVTLQKTNYLRELQVEGQKHSSFYVPSSAEEVLVRKRLATETLTGGLVLGNYHGKRISPFLNGV